MSPFISSLSTLTAPLWELVKENVAFNWNTANQQAFDAIKDAISTETTLVYYDPTKEVTFQADASTPSLRATLCRMESQLLLPAKL